MQAKVKEILRRMRCEENAQWYNAMQYGEFLSSSLSPEAYRKILPSISDLVHKFNLDIEVALQVQTFYQ